MINFPLTNQSSLTKIFNRRKDCMCIFTCLPFLMFFISLNNFLFPSGSILHFMSLSPSHTFFNIFCSERILVMNSFGFYMPEKKNCLLFLKYIFTNCRTVDWLFCFVCFFQYFKEAVPLLPVFQCFWCDVIIFPSFYNVSAFSGYF